MRRVVFFGTLLVCWSRMVGTSSFFDGAADYWYSNDDGVILDSIAPSTLYRSYNNEDKINSNNSHMATSTYTARREQQKNNWTLEFDDDGTHTLNKMLSFLRLAVGAPLQKFTYNPRIERLQNSRTPEEVWHCTDGPRKKLDSCNYCVCFGGQLYLCTARSCPTRNNAGIQVYIPYREYKNGACIEGEQIQSFDCNRCWCSAGQVLCTVKTCTRTAKKRPCTPGEPQRSLDGCNTCGCNLRRELYCTTKTCHNNPREATELDHNGCIPNTWYSLESPTETKCKQCYCLSGVISVCFMKLCRGPLPQLGSKCSPGTKKSDRCTRCTCTVRREWKCYTRLSRKCSDYDMKFNLKSKLNQQMGHKTRAASEYKSMQNNDILQDQYEDEDEVIAEKEKIRLEKERQEREKREKQEREKQKREKEEQEKREKEEQEKRKKEEEEKIKKIEREEKEENEYLFPFDFFPEQTDTRWSEETTTEKTTTRRPYGPFSTIPRFDGHLPSGAQCGRGESFTLGTKMTCQGCFCTAAGRWRCYSVRSPCRAQSSCSPRKITYEKNPDINCSICSCGQTGLRMCFTDETCAQKILKSNCDAVVCSRRCRKARWDEGFCHQDRCHCL